jgi:hypothetical protein
MARKKSMGGSPNLFGKVEPKRSGGAEKRNIKDVKQSQVGVVPKAGKGRSRR